MTRTSEQNERARREYTDENPDPRFRPSVSRLVMKLRTLPSLEDPEAVAFVVDDLLHRHFVFNHRRPNQLWYIARQAVSYWQQVLGAGGISEKANSDLVNFAFTTEDDPKMLSLPLDNKKLKKRVRVIIQDHTFSPREIVGKKSTVIPGCSCMEEFDLFEDWAKHVRELIWKEIDDAVDRTTPVGDSDVSSDSEK